jgi:hypothetical protein
MCPGRVAETGLKILLVLLSTLQNIAGRRRAMGRSIPMPIRRLSQALERARTEQGEIVRVVSS